ARRRQGSTSSAARAGPEATLVGADLPAISERSLRRRSGSSQTQDVSFAPETRKGGAANEGQEDSAGPRARRRVPGSTTGRARAGVASRHGARGDGRAVWTTARRPRGAPRDALGTL